MCPSRGLLYSTGAGFHLWERLRFQNAIWHGFVLLEVLQTEVAVKRFNQLRESISVGGLFHPAADITCLTEALLGSLRERQDGFRAACWGRGRWDGV